MATTNYRKEAMQAEQDTTYNGWTNYATWGVKLVLDNDQGTYDHVRNMADLIKRQAAEDKNVPEIWTEDEAARFNLTDAIKDYVEEITLDEDSTGIELNLMQRQVIQAGLSDVNWEEIAQNVLDES